MPTSRLSPPLLAWLRVTVRLLGRCRQGSFVSLLFLLPFAGLLGSCGRHANAPERGALEEAVVETVVGGGQVQSETGRVVARVRPGVSPQQLAGTYGTSVLAVVPELNLVLLSIPPGTSQQQFLWALQSDPRVIFAEPDYALHSPEGRQSTMAFSEGLRPWSDVTDQTSMERVRVPEAHSLALGRGVLVAVLDTGVDLDHPLLAGRIDLPGFEPGVSVNPGDDRAQSVDTNGDGILDGALGHGTHVAGVVVAVAPGARVFPVRVLDSDGVGTAFAVARGLVAAVTRGARVANLSLGMSGVSLSVAAAIDYARSTGVVVVAPAGNKSSEEMDFPARYRPVVAVAGTDDLDRKAAFSSYGPDVDLAAPAAGILSTYAGGGCATWSGTSMAVSFVSGASALLWERLAAGPAGAATVEHALRAGARSLAGTEPQFHSALGAGRLDARESLGAISPSGGGATPPGGPGEGSPVGGGAAGS